MIFPDLDWSFHVQVLQGLCHLVLQKPAEAEQLLRSARQQASAVEGVQLPKPASILLTFSLEDQGRLAEAEQVLPQCPPVKHERPCEPSVLAHAWCCCSMFAQ